MAISVEGINISHLVNIHKRPRLWPSCYKIYYMAKWFWPNIYKGTKPVITGITQLPFLILWLYITSNHIHAMMKKVVHKSDFEPSNTNYGISFSSSFITITSHECHVISKHWRSDGLPNSLSTLTIKKYKWCALLALYVGNPPVPGRQSASNVNSHTKASDTELWCFLWSASE